MNEKDNRERADGHDPQRQVDHLVSAMESESPIANESTDDRAARLLGAAIRESAEIDCPDPSDELKQLVMSQLSNEPVSKINEVSKPMKPTKESLPTTTSFPWRGWAAFAAAILILAGAGYMMYPLVPQGVNLAGDLKKEDGSGMSSSGPASNGIDKSVEESTKVERNKADEENRWSKPEYAEQTVLENESKRDSLSSSASKKFEDKPMDSKPFADGLLGRPISEPIMPNEGNTTLGVGGGKRGELSELTRSPNPMPSPSRRSRKKRGWESAGGYGYSGGGFDGDGRDSWRELGAEQYDSIVENTFKSTDGLGALSTFSIDVDTASYANVRRFLTHGQRVPPNAVRIEEMVNYFDYDYPQPEGDDPFSVNMELATCPWNTNNKLLRIGLQGKEIHRDERPAANIVFLLDVSGSMRSEDKLPLLKSGFQLMVNALNENDTVSIVTYAGNAGVVLEPTSGDQKRKINDAIEQLQSGGSTNGSAGIEMAYELAQRHFIKDGSNKVILATDGDLNVGVTSDQELVKLIKNKASEGVFLTVLGFGTGNLKDSKMEKLADNGNGVYAYIDGVREAHKVLVEGMSGSLVTIAKDVKLQLEFNPAEVKSYRLIGYENRVLAAKDFDDDKKDAGEIGAGHTVTALYELVTVDSPETDATAPEGLKYQKPSQKDVAKDDDENDLENVKPGELLTLALRFKQPDSETSTRSEYTLKDEDNSFSSASGDFRFASSVAAFGMLLRGSEHRGTATSQWVRETASGAIGDDTSGYRSEFIDLVRRFNSAR